MSKALGKKKGKSKGMSIKKWKGIKNDIDSFWFQNLTTTGQSSPKMTNKLNTTAPINFTNLGVTQFVNTKGLKDSGTKIHANLEKTMTYGTNTKRSFSNRFCTDTNDPKANSNSLRMSYKVPSGLSNISDSEHSIVYKNKTTKFKKISSNRGSTKPIIVTNSGNHRKNNSIKIRKRGAQIRAKYKMQTAPTSPSCRNVQNQGSSIKIKNTKEIEYKSFVKHKEEKKARK